jgi:hypothetical protein
MTVDIEEDRVVVVVVIAVAGSLTIAVGAVRTVGAYSSVCSVLLDWRVNPIYRSRFIVVLVCSSKQ